MKTGLIGSSMSGKTTIYNALTNSQESVGTGNREIHISNVKVPDKRLDRLSQIYKPKKTTYAEIDFVDFASGFDAKTEAAIIAKIREQDCLGLVIGAFKQDSEKGLITEYTNLLSEMILSDLMVCERRVNRLEREAKKDQEYKTLVKCKDALEQEQFIYQLGLSEEEKKIISTFKFLTNIPVIVLINVSEDDFNKKSYPQLEKECTEKGLDFLYLSGKLEMEIAMLPSEDQKVFLEDLGISEGAKDRFIRKAYEKMNLISFFTAGEDEVKAWTIKKDTIAQKAAGKIHSDIERGFIRAEVMSYDDFLAHGEDENSVKAAGRLRLEGKVYIVQDADIINYRFNV